MRKFILSLITLGFIANANAQQNVVLPCGTDEHLHDMLHKNPELEQAKAKFEAEFANYYRSFVANEQNKVKLGKKAEAKYIIPVVVHVLHANGSENISDNQILSEINFLNKSFRNLNSDSINRRAGTYNGNPYDFKALAADAEIEFRLARKDPQGNCTNGIVRKYTPFTFKGNDDLKKLSSWDSKRYFNIWVVRSINRGNTIGIAGYAQFPFGFNNGSTTDGIMVIHNEFGNIGTSLPGQTPNVTTTTHEAGHWLGLYHPFQNAGDTCSIDGDGVEDTPPTQFNPSSTEPLRNRCNNPNFNSCSSTEKFDLPDMQENFMDYFIGNCASNMFTLGQKARMHFVLDNYRKTLWSSENLASTGVDGSVTNNCAPIGAFNTNTQTICAGGTVAFSEFSYNGPITSWNWSFPGGTPSSANTRIPPAVKYDNEGSYDVILEVTGAGGTQTTNLKNYITVLPASTSKKPGWRSNADWWYQNNWEQEGWTMEYDNPYSKFVRTGISYNNIAGMMLPQDPFNLKYSIGSSFSIISPAFDFSGTTNPYIALNYAFAQGALSANVGGGSTKESLTIQTSTDCGKTWINRANRTSANISTVGAITLANTVNFVPSDQSKWAELTFTGASFPKTNNVRFRIVFSYAGGNNFYIDNIRVGDGNATGINNELAKDIAFNVSPNPTSYVAQAQYNLKEFSTVSATLTDILGRQHVLVSGDKQAAGQQTITIDKEALGLSSGVYFINLTINEQSLSHKIVIQ